MRIYARVVALVVSVLAVGCGPIVNPGYISMQPRQAGKVDFQVHAGGGYPFWGWGSVHVEPYASAKTSIPLGITVTYPGNGAGRVGVRHRIARVLSLGGGAGVSIHPDEQPRGRGCIRVIGP